MGARWIQRVIRASIAVALAAASVAPLARAQAPLDPQTLVGEWAGEWNWKNNVKHHGPYSLTIEKVQGNTVFGRGDRGGGEFSVRGKLEGNRLTFGRTELVVDGTEMRGTLEGERAPQDIKLNKRK